MSTFDTSTETLALYAMGLLDSEERTAVDAQLRISAATREELALVTGDLAAFALTADMHSPAALMRQRLLKRVSRERKSAPLTQPAKTESATPFAGYAAQVSGFAMRNESYADPVAPRAIRRSAPEEEEVEHRNGFAAAMPFVSWALAAGMAFAAFYQYNARVDAYNKMNAMSAEMVRLQTDSHQARAVLQTLTDPMAQRVTLTRDSAPPVPMGKAAYMPEKGMLTFIGSNLEPLQPYKTYELWLIPADGRDPIPAGTFKPDEHGNASVLMPELPKGIPAKAFGVTVEDDGGAQAPTMPIILAGA
ncbi:MAG TPA: anti-sigma factor [Acidobacteriaceae bacterium]